MLRKSLFRPIDIAPLVFFRIVFGVLALLDVLGVWIYYHLYKGAFDPEQLQIKYYGFEWVQTLPDPWLSIVFWVIILAAVGIIIGKWYRFSATIFALGFSYIFLLEKCNYLNHGYLFCVLSYLMIFVPANRALALDLKNNPSLYTNQIAQWPVWLLKFLMAVVYIYGGFAKLNADWLQALPLKIWLPYKTDYFLIGPLLNQEWVAWLMSYGGLLHDLFIIPFMLFRKTRVPAFVICCSFHLANTMIFQIGIFPWMSMALTALFFPPDFPRRLVKFLQNKITIIKKWHLSYLGFLRNHVLHRKTSNAVVRNPLLLCIVLFIFCSVQLLIPFRQFLYPGNVAWTEEGHRYAWRMMLRGKSGKGYFQVRNLASAQEKKVYASKFLTKRQNRKFKSHPDMLLFVAHHIRDEYKEKWATDSIGVYANFKVKLNGRNFQQYTDPNVNLATEQWSWTEPWDWIMPLDEKDFPDNLKYQ